MMRFVLYLREFLTQDCSQNIRVWTPITRLMNIHQSYLKFKCTFLKFKPETGSLQVGIWQLALHAVKKHRQKATKELKRNYKHIHLSENFSKWKYRVRETSRDDGDDLYTPCTTIRPYSNETHAIMYSLLHNLLLMRANSNGWRIFQMALKWKLKPIRWWFQVKRRRSIILLCATLLGKNTS